MEWKCSENSYPNVCINNCHLLPIQNALPREVGSHRTWSAASAPWCLAPHCFTRKMLGFSWTFNCKCVCVPNGTPIRQDSKQYEWESGKGRNQGLAVVETLNCPYPMQKLFLIVSYCWILAVKCQGATHLPCSARVLDMFGLHTTYCPRADSETVGTRMMKNNTIPTCCNYYIAIPHSMLFLKSSQ